MADIDTVDNAWLSGRARYERWKQRFMMEFYRPAGLAMLRGMWMSLSPEQHAILKQQDPKAYENVEKLVLEG